MAAEPQDPVAALVRDADFDRYAATLFAPAAARPHLLALYAFDIELARIRDLVSEPMPGEIRLQWWRDALATPGGGEASGHPVVRALEAAIDYGRLPRPALEALVEARIDDLYDDPIASRPDLERRLGQTHSAVLRLATLIVAEGRDPGGADVCGHGGVARGIASLLRTLARDATRGQVLLPVDLMAGHGVSRDDVVGRRATPGVAAVVEDLRDLALEHLAKARSAYAEIDPKASAALLPLATIGDDLASVSAADPFTPRGGPARWRRMWRLWRKSRATPPF